MSKAIFIVDDDVMFATLLRDHLNELGDFKISVFHTGEECLEHLTENPDIIILDHYLDSEVPTAKSGLEILKIIHKTHPDQKVIMLSAQEHYGIALQTIQSGAVEYVIKDLQSIQEIDKILREVM